MTALDVLCLGEPLLEFCEVGAGRWLESVGGDVSNVAAAVRRQGARSGVATRIGTDPSGDQLVRRWREEQIDIEAVVRDDTAPTGVYFVRHDASGHQFEYRRTGSAASRMSPDNLPLPAIRATRVLHLSGITQAISESAAEAAIAAMDAARAAGVTVSYDPNLRLKLWPLERARAVIEDAMRRVDIALPGLEDARLLTGLEDPEAIVRFYRDLGADVVALTLAGEGALIAYGDRAERIPPYPARLVDATGAGDCFDGTFLAEWLATGDPLAAGRYATVAAGLSVEGYGGVAPIPTRQQVEAALSGTLSSASASVLPASEDDGVQQRLALLAHEARKEQMIAWVRRHHRQLRNFDLLASGTTGARLAAEVPDLRIRSLESSPLGRDRQIGALITEGSLQGVIFFIDAAAPGPNDVDVNALLRLVAVHDLPMACSEATADILMRQFSPDDE